MIVNEVNAGDDKLRNTPWWCRGHGNLKNGTVDTLHPPTTTWQSQTSNAQSRIQLSLPVLVVQQKDYRRR